ncbi:MAG TPA: pilus assembly protein N-terminal domain-containing protein [Bryobacteraceae bacterium]
MNTLLRGLLVPLFLLALPELRLSSAPAAGAFEESTKNPTVTVPVNASTVVDHPAGIRRISIANGEIADAVAVSSTEVVVNGKLPGDTSLILWDQQGARLMFNIHVTANTSKLDAVRAELLKEAGPNVSINVQEGVVFLNGTTADAVAADRAFAIASTLGKVVNLLRVETPQADAQILLKVRFADVDRSASTQLGANLFGLNEKGVGTSTTGQFGTVPRITPNADGSNTFSITSFLNIFYYRPDINLGAVLQDLATRNLLQILAEPNLLTTSGKPASFLAGGEFPFPTLQGGGAGVGQITIQFKEFGIRLNFTPTITPRGTIKLVVNPEVSSLDYANALTVSGFTIPGLSSRKVQTEVELESGQSFVIAGLLNNQITQQLSRMPGFADIPLLGKLFQSRSVSKNNTELMVVVTPELVRPLAAGMKAPEISTPVPYMKDVPTVAPSHPGPAVTGPAPAIWKRDSLPIEELHIPAGGSEAPPPPAVPGAMPGLSSSSFGSNK